MGKVFKTLIFCWCLLIAVVVLAPADSPPHQTAFWCGGEPVVQKQIASAQNISSCGQLGRPIPMGEMLEGTVEIMDKVFEIYQNSANNLDLAISDVSSIIAALSENPEVCDFSLCSALVENIGFEKAGFEFDTLFLEPIGLGLEGIPPGCKPKECTGEPCPDLMMYLMGKSDEKGYVGLHTLADNFGTSAKILHEWFSADSKTVTNDIATGDAGSKITIVDFVNRKTDLVDEWLTPYSGKGPYTCALNASERKLVERGELDAREPMICSDAIQQGIYWPMAWSEECDKQKKCQYGLDQDCMQCLASNCLPEERAKSWYADINCQLFQDCSAQCAEKPGLDFECYECLCQRFENIEGGPDQACLDWICGGSDLNFVCCQR